MEKAQIGAKPENNAFTQIRERNDMKFTKSRISKVDGVLTAIAASLMLLFVGCSEQSDNPTAPGNFRVLFTDPYDDEELLEEALSLIAQAEKTIAVESYGFDLDTLANALIEAHNRGVLVRIACELDNYESASEGDPYFDMQIAGITIIPDNDDAITHNKVMIIDSTIVWTGSANFTANGYFYNNNNVVIIESGDVALAFLEDFAQMFSGNFHTNKIGDGAERYAVADGSVEIWFSPQDSPIDMLIQRINDARQSVDFCIFAYTLDDLAEAMIEAKNRGISVRGIFDEGCVADSTVTEYYSLLDAEVDVIIDPCPYAFHHKFIVIDANGDEPMVITGSGNFSWAGTHENDENFVVIHSKSVAQEYLSEFKRWWESIN